MRKKGLEFFYEMVNRVTNTNKKDFKKTDKNQVQRHKARPSEPGKQASQTEITSCFGELINILQDDYDKF